MLMPNFPIQTMGGKVYWNTVSYSKGWKIQQHRVSLHYRILDPTNVRQAWSYEWGVIESTFKKFTQHHFIGTL
ncbi:hypothetical protein [Planomicrobium okeanokoites]|uniref:hypothetical protein n=1 Tax=Planomicrobium okeanokoites TaxID=244 RepID=UPI0030F689AC